MLYGRFLLGLSFLLISFSIKITPIAVHKSISTFRSRDALLSRRVDAEHVRTNFPPLFIVSHCTVVSIVYRYRIYRLSRRVDAEHFLLSTDFLHVVC